MISAIKSELGTLRGPANNGNNGGWFGSFSARRSFVCCGWLPFHSAHLCSLCFGMTPASTQRRVICVHPGSFVSASLLGAGCGIRVDQQCVVRAVAACSAATCELAVRSRTRARAHSHRPLLNKAQSTEAPTAAARHVGLASAWVTCGQMWSGRGGTSRKSGAATIT